MVFGDRRVQEIGCCRAAMLATFGESRLRAQSASRRSVELASSIGRRPKSAACSRYAPCATELSRETRELWRAERTRPTSTRVRQISARVGRVDSKRFCPRGNAAPLPRSQPTQFLVVRPDAAVSFDSFEKTSPRGQSQYLVERRVDVSAIVVVPRIWRTSSTFWRSMTIEVLSGLDICFGHYRDIPADPLRESAS